MALTLLEQAKMVQDDYRRGVIETFGLSSNVLRNLPFVNIPGNAITFTREETLPTTAFRGVNETYTANQGVVKNITEPLSIAGGTLDVDRFILKTGSEELIAAQEMMKVKSLGLTWEKKFFKGDDSTAGEFDGLQSRIASGNDQYLAAGSTSGGDALSLAKLDEVIDKVDDPTHIYMNQTMIRALTKAARTYTIGGFINFELDAFGSAVTKYNGIPILPCGKDATNTEILPFTEANPGGGTAASTSIYVVSFGPASFSGIQNDTPDVEQLGATDDGTVYRTLVEWYAGIAVWQPRSVSRLCGIKNAAVTA